MYDHILIPTDGSGEIEQAGSHGIELARTDNAAVHVRYVEDTNTYAYEDVPRSSVGLLKESGDTALDESAAMGRERGFGLETPIRRGWPSRELLAYVDENDVDLVTLGTYGRTIEVQLGSPTERVIRTSSQPTLSVR